MTPLRYLNLLISTLLVFAGSFSLAQPSHQLLWEISGKGLKKPSYLYGTYHSNDKRVFRFSDSTYYALLNAKAVILEADIYEMFGIYNSREEAYSMMVDNDGKTYTRKRNASSTGYGDEDGLPQFLDAYFQQVATNMGKQFFPLETIEDQTVAYQSITYKKLTSFDFESLSWSKDRVLETYLKGDLDYMHQIMRSQLSVSDNAYHLLITNRNIIMANGIDTLIRKYPSFIGVGAAHLPGNEGIIYLLKQKGYQLRPVMATYSETPTEEAKSLKKYNQYTYTNQEYGFSVVLGSKPKEDYTEDHLKLVYQEMGQGNTYWIEVLPDESGKPLGQQLDDFFSSPRNSKISVVHLKDNTKAYEGLTTIYGIGDCWRRVFMLNGNIIKLTCFGGNKFMNSNRYQLFFNRVESLPH